MEKTARKDKAELAGRWPILFTAIIAILAAAGMFRGTIGPSGSPGSGANLLYGASAFALIIVLSGYRVRKAMIGYTVGTMHGWAQAHVYLGALCAALVFLHSGFTAGGRMSAALLFLFLLVTASGIVGAILYKTLPVTLSRQGKDLFSSSVLLARFAVLLEGADRQTEGRSEEFKQAYLRFIRPILASTSGRFWLLFMDEDEALGWGITALERAKKMIPPTEVYGMDMIGSILMEKERLTLKWTRLNALRAWLYLHVPATVALLVALSIHVVASFYF